ncbi:hypothetical protein Geob_0576 [Geotalea daltonii FRC-32]|uniref:Uncharacterized protein n=1 Tax=Geotalea daltonii (strain DSM 22248 / JCM 15807 / FRC-32) TaxID=316067 RepID=B9M0A6_GEODF|nr:MULTISPECIES: hypothetical protein [Geotalea]ACM18943.1 hypothetical protein Geob_0576 [Geotalea daltonii FRC-32]
MGNVKITALDRAMARLCETCPACRSAQRKQQGMAFWLVTRVEEKICPFCRAFEKVHGRKAHEQPD